MIVSSVGPKLSPREIHLRQVAVLLLLSALGTMALVPYYRALLLPAESWQETLRAHLPTLLFLYLSIEIGLRLGERLGLGAPPLRSLVGGRSDGTLRSLRSLGLGLVLGLACGSALLLIVLVPLPAPPVSSTLGSWTPAEAVLASVGAGITEEILFRFGLMTLFAWLGAAWFGSLRSPTGEPSRAIYWSASALAGILFGVAHLALAQLAFGSLTPLVVAVTIGGNFLAAMLFGWLYWRHGLLAAMTSHAATDVVLKVLGPALLPT